MENFKFLWISIFIMFSVIHWSCDDRLPSDSESEIVLESGSIELSYVYVNGPSDNPTIVGEVISESQISVIVIARFLNVEGEGVNDKVLSFTEEGVSGTWDILSQTYTTKYESNFKRFGLPDLTGNGYVYARFTPEIGQEKIETSSSSGSIIKVQYVGSDIIDNVEFSVYKENSQVWPYTMNITSNAQIDLGGETPFVVLLENAYGDELNGVRINIDSENGFVTCADSCITDQTGRVNTTFESYSFDENIGIGSVKTSYYHPAISDSVVVSKQIIIGTETAVGSCSYIEIPSSNPSTIVVKDGGGIESTDIKAEIYDNNGNLLTIPILVSFKLEPAMAESYLNTPGLTEVLVESVNGIATVSLNSGTEPGPIRIIATTNTIETTICDTLNDDLESITVPVIIASGAPYYIESEYDPNSTEAIGGGFYQTECAAIVYDKWYNPVEDSTYVYWNISPLPPATGIDAFVEGVSFTNNQGILSGVATSGVARSNIVYSTDAIGAIGQVRALTFGANGDSVVSFVNEGEGDATLFFLPGQVSLLSNSTYYDFSLYPSPAEIQISALVIDFYGNPVVGAPVAFSGTGVSAYSEIGYESYEDFGVDTLDGTNDAGEGDLCFTWRDYGRDNLPENMDEGQGNDSHDSFLDSLGFLEGQEVSENFDDFGLDGINLTFDEGEGDGKWNGYSMINCEPVVKTDSDGYARIMVQFDQAICTLANIDDTTDPSTCSYDDFTASLSATLLISEITTSDPLDILLVRSPAACP